MLADKIFQMKKMDFTGHILKVIYHKILRWITCLICSKININFFFICFSMSVLQYVLSEIAQELCIKCWLSTNVIIIFQLCIKCFISLSLNIHISFSLPLYIYIYIYSYGKYGKLHLIKVNISNVQRIIYFCNISFWCWEVWRRARLSPLGIAGLEKWLH